jgi:hypothetical protein
MARRPVGQLQDQKKKEARVEGQWVHTQALIPRGVHFAFRDLCASHDLPFDKGLAWAMRSLLASAGVIVREQTDSERAEKAK